MIEPASADARAWRAASRAEGGCIRANLAVKSSPTQADEAVRKLLGEAVSRYRDAYAAAVEAERLQSAGDARGAGRRASHAERHANAAADLCREVAATLGR